MEPQLIRSLVQYEPASKLEIRVCRIWITKTIGADSQAASLNSVFVDKEVTKLKLYTYLLNALNLLALLILFIFLHYKGNAIHATMNS